MQKVLITGHKGFIGKYLLSYLQNKDLYVFTYTEDIRSIHLTDKIYDVIVHLAAKTSSKDILENPTECFSVNVSGTQSVLEYCRKAKCKLIFLSTSAVYGSLNSEKKIPEDHPLAPKSIYGLSKKISEELCEYYNQSYQISISILRIFNVYGIGQKPGFILPDILNSLSSNSPLVLRNPDAVRDFIFIEDVCEAIFKSIEVKGFSVFNVGSGKGIRILDLVKTIENIFQRKISVQSEINTIQELSYSVADNYKISNTLNWKPRISIEDGLKKIQNEK
ncbi:MAG: NAD(P)-dependent oxidoreductase [Leptospiraceae bacterium]|nr:NAD(P)-dependent oxidoreductase [Leptospiraceae bacterium]